jgi:ribosomal protein L37AE/L43A
MIVRSRPARLGEIIRDAPRRCPTCRRRIGRRFTVLYFGDPTRPETVQVAGWQCGRCGAGHAAEVAV